MAADKFCFARNIRSYQQGAVTSRPGLTTFTSLGTGADYYTAIARLNNFNIAFFGSAWDFSYILGLTQKLYVGKDNTHLTNGTINPVLTPLTPSGSGLSAAFSGNPLSLVDAQPVGSTVAWKYIADSQQMVAVGYYPGDNPNTLVGPTMARCITMGMLPPVTQTIPATAGAGLLNGAYQWRFVYRRTNTGAQSNPSAPTRVTVASPSLTLTNQAASMTLPTTPIDPQTGSADAHVVVDVYRFGGTVFSWVLVGTGNSGATFTDNLADSVLNSAQQPSQAVNPNTGLTHFNLFQPFPIPDIGHFGTGNLAQNGAGKWIFSWATGQKFNVGWLPGSTIGINNAPVFTIYQVIDNQTIELTEDATRVGAGTGYPYAVPTGTIAAGQAVKHIWGPWGTGQTGAFIFGCGNQMAPGTLFWCNGNDPDSSDTYNSLQVTDPSEPLMNGCMYQGNSYVWSTERMFEIVPSLTVSGQFVVNEIPGGRGIWMEYSLTVQSNSIADLSITWRGKDGIYDYSAGAGLRSLTADDMYPFFPHDNEVGTPPSTLFPFLPASSEPVPAPDDAQSSFQRLTWFDGYLFYDFLGNSNSANQSWTLVYDSRVNGWICLDRYASLNLEICRGIEIAANNLKIGIGNVLYDYTGTSDAGTAIPCRVVTRADDYGDGRAQKQLGDLMIDVNPGGSTVAANLLTAYHNTSTALSNIAGTTRTQAIEDFVSGGGLYSITAGLDITWNASAAGTATLYQYQLAYLVKPEFTVARATDWDDDGYEGAKFFQGLIIQFNTAGATVQLTVQSDGGVVQQSFPGLTSSGELEIPLTFNTPFISHQVRIYSNLPLAMMGPFRIRWIWEPAPELAKNWITQPTSFGLRGYFSHRDSYIAIQSTDVVVLSISPDAAPAVSLSFPSTAGNFLKPYTALPPLKCKLGQYSVTSCTPFRLFVKDSEMRVKEWGNPGPYQVVRPFGDISFEKGARI